MSSVTCVLHHNIGKETRFEQGLGVSTDVATYEEQIAWMAKNYDFIDLETLLTGRLPKRPLLLTFDDAFRSVADIVKTILAPQGIPSVYFINPGLLEKDAISLDSTLAWAASEVGLGELCKALDLAPRDSVGAVIVGDMAAFGAQQRAAIKSRVIDLFGLRDLSARQPLLDVEILRTLPGLGVEIGNHTMTHVHGRALSKAEIEDEIVGSKQRLETLSGAPVRSFSVPYGHEDDLPSDVLAAVRASGHEAIFLVHARSNRSRPAADIWYRTSLHNEAASTLRKTLYYLPLLRSFKQRLLG